VTITNSGNVEAGAGASLTWDNAALIHTLVTIGGGAAAPSGTTAGDATRIVTNVTASANVRMSGTAEGSLTFLNNGSVISPLVDISTADAEVDVSTHDLGNVFTPNARLVMDTAYVLAGHVRVAMHPHALWSCARAAVNVRSAVGGQVTALSLDMERASIVEETIDVKIEHDMCTHLNVSAELTSVASLTVSEHVFFENSQLLDETVDVDLHQHSMGEGLHANVVVSLDDTANAYMSGTADMRVYNSSELIDETFDFSMPNQSLSSCNSPQCCMRLNLNVSVTVGNSGNLITGGGVDFYGGELIDETVDMSGCFGAHSIVNARSILTNVANVQAAGSVTIYDGDITDEVIDIDGYTADGVWSLTVEMRDSARITASSLSICEGELVDEIFDLSGEIVGTVWHLHGMIDNVGQVQAANVSIFEGELIDEVFDVEFLFHGSANISMANSANVDATLVHIVGQLVDEYVDVLALSSATMFLRIENVANVRASESLLIEHGELLDEALDIETNVTDSFISLQVLSSANVRQAGRTTVLGSLVDPLFEARLVQGSTVHIFTRDIGNVLGSIFEINPAVGALKCFDTPIFCMEDDEPLHVKLTLAELAAPQVPCTAAPNLLLDVARQGNEWLDDVSSALPNNPASQARVHCMVGLKESGTVTAGGTSVGGGGDLWTAPLIKVKQTLLSRLGVSVENSLNTIVNSVQLLNYSFDNATNVTCPDTWAPAWRLPTVTSVADQFVN